MLLDSNFQFEMKVCPECKIEKMKVANFSLKGTYCRECLRLKSRKREGRGYGNLKNPWRSFSLASRRPGEARSVWI